jgi:hypothetical protein
LSWEDFQDKTARTEQLAQYCWDKKAGTGQKGEDSQSQNETSRTGQTGEDCKYRTVRTVLVGQDSQSRTAWTGQPLKNSWDRTAGTKQLGQDSQGRTAGKEQPGKNSHDRTARIKKGTGLKCRLQEGRTAKTELSIYDCQDRAVSPVFAMIQR